MENEIKAMLKLVVDTRRKNEKVQKQIDTLRKSYNGIKEANRETCIKLDQENKRLDEELAEKERKLYKEKDENEKQACAVRAKFLRQIILCNLKNLHINQPKRPENTLSTIYAGLSVLVYDDVMLGEKPVNQYEYSIKIELAMENETGQNGQLQNLLSKIWPTFQELHGGWNSPRVYFQRDFKTTEDARGYARRNRAKITKPLIASIKQFEKEIKEANGSIDAVFDFRLHINPELDPNYSHSDRFKIISAKKHKLILNPFLSNYDRIVQKAKLYKIIVQQKGYQITISGHRNAKEARDILYAIQNYFETKFTGIEADTKQNIRHPYH